MDRQWGQIRGDVRLLAGNPGGRPDSSVRYGGLWDRTALWLRGDAGGQARHILQKIEEAVKELGGTREDIVFTRVYLKKKEDLMAVAPVHAEYFGETRPASTLVLTGFVDDDFLLEIDAEAVIGSGSRDLSRQTGNALVREVIAPSGTEGAHHGAIERSERPPV